MQCDCSPLLSYILTLECAALRLCLPCVASSVLDERGARADLPAPGTNDVYRVCTPFPFEANITATAAQRDMELHIDNFEAFVYFSPGASRAGPGRAHAHATRAARPLRVVQGRSAQRKWTYCIHAHATHAARPLRVVQGRSAQRKWTYCKAVCWQRCAAR